jgi:hypothetical protein
MDLGRDVSAKPVLRSATPEAGANVAAAAASKAVAVAAAASKAVAVAAAATKAVGLKGYETKAVAVAAVAKKAKSAAAEEDAKALEAREAAAVWKTKCSTCSKAYHSCTGILVLLLESIPAKGKLALQAGVLTHTRTPAHPHTRTCA